MKVLGIESSCDETAAAIVKPRVDGRGLELLSSVVHSQIDIHREFGGVVPEVAARSHLEVINPVIAKALQAADSTWDDIDAIAVTTAPGLVGSLLVGTLAARTLSLLYDKPIYPIHHVEAHVYANFITKDGRPNQQFSTPLPVQAPQFPLLALIVSGGHTQLVLFKDHGNYQLLGQTRDDAVGEAFDKVAKIIGLPYPGGPSIAQAATQGDATFYKLPIAKLDDPYSFSFSGLKTAVLRAVQQEVGVDYTFPSHQLAERLNSVQQANFAASFQSTAVDTLIKATLRAYKHYQPVSVVIAGGVAANQLLRQRLRESMPIAIEYAPIELCTDNAAMIAALGVYQTQYIKPTPPELIDVQPVTSMKDSAWA